MKSRDYDLELLKAIEDFSSAEDLEKNYLKIKGIVNAYIIEQSNIAVSEVRSRSFDEGYNYHKEDRSKSSDAGYDSWYSDGFNDAERYL